MECNPKKAPRRLGLNRGTQWRRIHRHGADWKSDSNRPYDSRPGGKVKIFPKIFRYRID